MIRSRIILLALAVVAALVAAGGAAAAGDDSPGAVYTLTNAASGNAVAVFARAADGTLAPSRTVATEGNGTGALLGSQGALVLSDDGRAIFAVNAGSNSISQLTVTPHGVELVSTAPSGGTLPISVTVHGSWVYALNAGSGTISGFVASQNGLTPITGSTRALGAGAAGPAQVQFSPDGRTLAVTNKASSTIDTFAVGFDGVAAPAVTSASAGATPFGFDFDNRGHLLVSEAGSGSASSYSLAAGGAASVTSGAVATHQGAPCWLVASKNGRYAYTANGGSGTITGFAVGGDGSLSLLDGSGVTADLGAGSHPLDETTSGNGRYLYNLTDGRHTISAFRIEADGSLTPLGTAGVLPAGAEGIAAK